MKPNQTLRYKPEPVLKVIFKPLSVALITMACVALILLHADKIDGFFNTKAGALTLFTVFGICGAIWFVWRIKRIF